MLAEWAGELRLGWGSVQGLKDQTQTGLPLLLLKQLEVPRKSWERLSGARRYSSGGEGRTPDASSQSHGDKVRRGAS